VEKPVPARQEHAALIVRSSAPKLAFDMQPSLADDAEHDHELDKGESMLVHGLPPGS
jgi:hypothetical protein